MKSKDKIVGKNPFAGVQKGVVVILLVLTGCFYSCAKRAEVGDDVQCKPCQYEEYGSSPQDFFRYVNDEKHYLEISSNEVIVKVGEKMTENEIECFFLKNASLQVCDISEMSDNGFTLVSFSDCNRNAIKQLTSQLKLNDTILFVGQIIIDETGKNTSALTNQINVRLKEDDDFPILQGALASYDIGKVEQCEWADRRTYLLIVNYFSEKSALQIANELYETGLFEYAEPNLLLFIRYDI